MQVHAELLAAIRVEAPDPKTLSPAGIGGEGWGEAAIQSLTRMELDSTSKFVEPECRQWVPKHEMQTTPTPKANLFFLAAVHSSISQCPLSAKQAPLDHWNKA